MQYCKRILLWGGGSSSWSKSRMNYRTYAQQRQGSEKGVWDLTARPTGNKWLLSVPCWLYPPLVTLVGLWQRQQGLRDSSYHLRKLSHMLPNSACWLMSCQYLDIGHGGLIYKTEMGTRYHQHPTPFVTQSPGTTGEAALRVPPKPSPKP